MTTIWRSCNPGLHKQKMGCICDIASVALLITLQTSLATFDVEALKAKAATNLQALSEVAATNLQTFTGKASEKLQTLHEKAASKLQELTENASNNLHDIANSIDLEKLKKIDFLNIIPRVHDRVLHKKHKIQNKIKFLGSVTGLSDGAGLSGNHISSVKGLHIDGNDLKLAFEGKYPWPVVTRRVEYIYE